MTDGGPARRFGELEVRLSRRTRADGIGVEVLVVWGAPNGLVLSTGSTDPAAMRVNGDPVLIRGNALVIASSVHTQVLEQVADLVRGDDGRARYVLEIGDGDAILWPAPDARTPLSRLAGPDVPARLARVVEGLLCPDAERVQRAFETLRSPWPGLRLHAIDALLLQAPAVARPAAMAVAEDVDDVVRMAACIGLVDLGSAGDDVEQRLARAIVTLVSPAREPERLIRFLDGVHRGSPRAGVLRACVHAVCASPHSGVTLAGCRAACAIDDPAGVEQLLRLIRTGWAGDLPDLCKLLASFRTRGDEEARAALLARLAGLVTEPPVGPQPEGIKALCAALASLGVIADVDAIQKLRRLHPGVARRLITEIQAAFGAVDRGHVALAVDGGDVALADEAGAVSVAPLVTPRQPR